MADWLNTDEAARYLGLSSSNVYSLAQQNRIPAHKVGKVWRFNRDELDGWVKANKPLDEFFAKAEAFIDLNPLLRDPQIEGYKATYDFFAKGGKKAVIQIPVGGGKTGLIAILPFGIARGRILVIAPNLTIVEELKRNLDVGDRRSCFWSRTKVLSPETMAAGPYVAVLDSEANIHDCDRSHIVLTNIQQLASSVDKWLPAFPDNFFDMVLVDEGHHSAARSWEKVFEKFPDAKVVNFTATPFRSDRKEIEGELIYRFSFRQAMLKGYIKRLQAVYVAPQEIYFTYQGDDYRHTLEEVLELKEEDWFSKGVALSEECNRHIVDASLEKLEGLRLSGTRHQVIAVACSVAHARVIRSLYRERGYEADEIHSGMSDEERLEVLRKLRAGLLDCIVQVQILGEGFDHPHLSVAAIFRPFRSLAPYLQFVGRIMRVVVQNDPRHPDNYGFVVTHVGLNLDQQLADFKDMERDDVSFFEGLISGEEPDVPPEVLEGRARMKLTPDMVVHRELISEFLEESFLTGDDQLLLEELKAQAEALGFDGEKIAEVLKEHATDKVRRVKAAEPFPVLPQRHRHETRKRLSEEAQRTAKLLLNRMDLEFGGRELALKYRIGVTGNNFVAAVQLVNREIDRGLGIGRGQRAKVKSEDLERGITLLPEILNTLTRRLAKVIRDEEVTD